jgi:hypothetical protein
VVGHHDAEDGVAQELEPLVGRVARVLGTPRPVDERRRQEVSRQADAEAVDQASQSGNREVDRAS